MSSFSRFALVAAWGSLAACYGYWEYPGEPRGVEAVGEVRDARGDLAAGVEVRILKHWPRAGDEPREPPPEVLFADAPAAPPDAPYGVELIAVAVTDARGWFEVHLDAEAVADPRFAPDADGRVVPAYTLVVVRGEAGGVYSYSWRYARYYRHHCELLTLGALEPTVSFARTADERRVDLEVRRARQEIASADAPRRYDYRFTIRGPEAALEAACSEDVRGLSGCEAVGERIRLSLPADPLRTLYADERGRFFAEVAVTGPTHRSFAAFAVPDDPTWGGAYATPDEPPDEPPEPPQDPPDEPPEPPQDPPSGPGELALIGAWAVGASGRVDLLDTAATDGDPLTRRALDELPGASAVYVALGDVRLAEAGLLNTLVDDAEANCLAVETSPTVYAHLDAAREGLDWTPTGRFCGSNGARNEVSVVQRFTTTDAHGKRAGWLRVRAAPGDRIELRAIGEVVALGWR